MAEYTYDPTQGKIVPLSQARVVTYITTDPGRIPDEQNKKAAAAAAVTAAQGAGIVTKSSGGFTDLQNAARLEAERIATENSSYNVRSTAGDELLKKQAADKAAGITPKAAVPVTATPSVTNPKTVTTTGTATFTPTPTPTPTPDPDSVDFASLTSEEQAAIGNIGEQGLATTSNITTEAPGKYTFDPKTGILLLDGQPYTGSYNGFDYENGNKKDATTKQIVDLNTKDNPLELTGPTDAELARLDAFAQLQDLFESYNLGSLAGKITEYMKQGKGPNETVLLLKKSPEYNLRFQGNTLRLASGLNVMSEASYLELEDSYANTLRAYGLGNMLSPDRTKNEAMFAKYMGNDLNAPEFKSRIALATERVINADAMTKGLFKEFYPNLTDSDLVAYFLAPKDTLSRLQEKVTSAEIGTAAIAQGLETSMASATDLAKFGIDKDAAIKGYSEIQEVLPTSQKLGNVYQEAGIKYDQATGEAEFFKQNQDAKLKRKRLESLERGSFSGSAGNAPGAYSTGYLKKSSVAGLI